MDKRIKIIIALLDLELVFAASPGAAAAALGGCVADLDEPVDVELIGLTGLSQAAREPGGRVSMAPSADLVNHGPGDVAWNRAISPDTPVGPHPYLALHMYRLADGVLEQIGRADLKHAFFATNTGCPCAGGNVLFVGCEDQYGVTTNLNQRNLAPRAELDSLTRAWTSLGSHFDGVPVDDFRHHAGGSAHDDFEHRLVVLEPDLQTPGAGYFVEAWYLAPNDTNLLNSLGHRQVTPSFGGSSWAFPDAAPLELGPILDVWVDPSSPGPGEMSALVDTGAGRAQLAVVVTVLGGGIYRYEWALQNFDYEAQLRTFSVGVRPEMSVSNSGFGDGDGDPENDWTLSVGSNLATWSAPSDNELDWGRLYNFRMDVDAAPLDSLALMRPLAGEGTVSIETLAPALVVIPALPWPILAPALALLLAVVAGLRARARAGSPKNR